MRGELLLGVLNVENERMDGFGEADIKMVHSVADMIAFALENANLYAQAQQEIVERRQAEAAMRESEKRLKEAQRIALIGNWELDLDNNNLTWSDEIYRIFEIDPTKFGASYAAFLDAIHPADREAVDQAYTTSLQTRSSYEIDHRLLMPDGRVKYVLERCESFYSVDGHPLRSVGTVQDITERKHTEESLLSLKRS
ncbi:MAG: PAS domain-containing protein, partial [Chloroflexota bacterium]